jgi:hypothetical protein
LCTNATLLRGGGEGVGEIFLIEEIENSKINHTTKIPMKV